MLKKLRLKFILINMIIVTIILSVIFSLLYFSSSRNLEWESTQTMEKLIVSPINTDLPKHPPNDIRLPYLSVSMNQKGEIIEADSNYFDLSDQDRLMSILALVDDSKSERGVLHDYKLRYLRSETPREVRVVLADMSREQSMLHNLIQTFLIIGSAAFLLFLVISVFLARWAVKPVESAWQKQKQFVADASHELKTPLTVIMTDAELLHSPDCLEGDRGLLTESILTMSSQMRGLVENLLDLARIDNGSEKEDFSVVSFSDIVSDVTMTMEPLFFEKELPLRYEIEPDIRINGIPAHLNQLVCIFMDNAGKYVSPGGETVVRLSRCAHKRCRLVVSNQGNPISDEDIKNIFKRFYRADKARTMNHSYGLGLSIAQNIAEEHRGKIWAKSEGGYNSFFVELPCLE